jgi:hypothetical protein
MQTANILVDIGGPEARGNTVPLYGVTASEIALLRHIHGLESVLDVEPAGEVERTNASEHRYLAARYGVNADTKKPKVEDLFPGVGARMFETLDELDLPDEYYKTASRVTARSKPSKTAAALAEVGSALTVADDEDGIGDMPPAGGSALG